MSRDSPTNGACFADPGFEVEAEDSAEEKLSTIAQRCERFAYEYDFGDGWQHDNATSGRKPNLE